MPLGKIDPRRIPIIGNDLYQVGQVYDIVSQPCSPDPWIAIKAAFAYSPTLVWSLLKPEPLDMAYERAGVSHRRIRKRSMRVNALMQLPEPKPGTVGWKIFQAAQIGERVGWYLLVLDATTDFAINWSSLVWQWSGCPSIPSGDAWFKGGGIALGGQANRFRVSIPGAEHGHTTPGHSEDRSVSINSWGPKTLAVTVRLKVTPYGGGPGIVHGLKVIRNPFTADAHEEDASPDDPDDAGTTWSFADSIWSETAPPVTYQVFADVEGGTVVTEAVNVRLDGAPAGGLIHDP